MIFNLKPENGIIVITSQHGGVQQSDILETMKYIADNPATYQNKKLLIIDPGSNYDPSTDELQQFTDLIKNLFTALSLRIALVVSKDIHFGLGRMAEVFTESREGQLRVFRSEKEARVWLET